MPASSIALHNHDDSLCTVTMIGTTGTSIAYRDITLPLSAPHTLDVTTKFGDPSSKANDKVTLTDRLVKINATTGVVAVGSATLSLSVPRDSVWTLTDTENLITHIGYYLGTSNNRVALAEGTLA